MKVIRLSMTRLYLLSDGNDRYCLIDTGYRGEYDRFRRSLAAAGIGVGDIHSLFLTHHHDDHAGFAAQLMEENPGITVIARAESEPLLAAGVNRAPEGASLLNRRIRALFNLKRRMSPDWDLSYPPVKLRPQDMRLEDERSDLGELLGFKAEALYTPGHTIDSQSLLLADGRLFCGDLAARFLNFAGAKYCTLFNEEIEQVYRSWRRVLEGGARRIYPAHGRSFKAELLRKYIGSHSRKTVVDYPG